MPFRDFVQKNFWLKLFSIVLATLIWLAIRYNSDSQSFPASRAGEVDKRFNDLPVWIMKAPGEARSFLIDPEKVTVRLRGPENLMQAVRPEEIRVFVRLGGGEEVASPVALEAVPPRGTTLLEVIPNAISVRIRR